MAASVTIYDGRDRPSLTVETAPWVPSAEAWTASVSFAYSRGGLPLSQTATLARGGRTQLSATLRRSFDTRGRLTGAWLSASGEACPESVEERRVYSAVYGETGEIASATVGDIPVQYGHDIRGSLVSVSSPAFSQTAGFTSGRSPQYGGNLSWVREEILGVKAGYDFSYDGAGRLTAALSPDGLPDLSCTYAYGSGMALVALTRRGPVGGGEYATVDDLEIVREGTRIVRVTDHAPEVLLESSADFCADAGEALYARDSRGALVSDTGRGIHSVESSPSGTPLCIGMEGGYAFRYVYDSEGRRLRSSLTGPGKGFIGWEPIPDIQLPLTADGAADGTTAGDVKFPARLLASRSRIGSIELDGDTVARLLTPWGWLTAKDGVFHSAVADRRGDIRAVASPQILLDHIVIEGDSIRGRSDDGQALSARAAGGGLSGIAEKVRIFNIGAESYFLEQANFYYPFGLPAAIGWGADANTRKFGGKELELRRGLGLYDFGARLYDPALAAFTSPDPLAAEKPWADPYLYGRGNPISFIDPDGRDEFQITYSGKFLGREEYEDDDVIQMMTEDGRRAEGNRLFLDEGSIIDVMTIPNNGHPYTLINVNGWENGREVFEFLSQSTSVEWSHASVLDRDYSHKSLLTSSMKDDREGGMYSLYDRISIYDKKIKFIDISHVHPNGAAIPSGYNMGEKEEVPGDVEFAAHVCENHKSTFHIYIPYSGVYVPFGPRSTLGMYRYFNLGNRSVFHTFLRMIVGVLCRDIDNKKDKQ